MSLPSSSTFILAAVWNNKNTYRFRFRCRKSIDYREAFWVKNRCRNRQFLGVQRVFCPKKFYATNFSLQIFCSCCWIIFSSTMVPQAGNLKIDTCNMVLHNTTEKPYARLWKNIVRRQLTQCFWTSVSQFWGCPITFQLSAKKLGPTTDYMPWVSHCLFNSTYTQHARNCMAKCIHPNTVVKIKTFLYLPGMDSTQRQSEWG